MPAHMFPFLTALAKTQSPQTESLTLHCFIQPIRNINLILVNSKELAITPLYARCWKTHVLAVPFTSNEKTQKDTAINFDAIVIQRNTKIATPFLRNVSLRTMFPRPPTNTVQVILKQHSLVWKIIKWRVSQESSRLAIDVSNPPHKLKETKGFIVIVRKIMKRGVIWTYKYSWTKETVHGTSTRILIFNTQIIFPTNARHQL